MKKRKKVLSVASRHKIDRLYSFTWGVVFAVAFIAMCFKILVAIDQKAVNTLVKKGYTVEEAMEIILED